MDILEIKIQLLAIEKRKKLKELEKKYEENGLLSSGDYLNAIGLIEAEYALRKEQVRTETINKEEQEHSSPRPKLFNKTKRYIRYYKLEKLFNEVDFATYPTIAYFIGDIKARTKYLQHNKKQILIMVKIFNRYATKKWEKKLKATKDKFNDGLKLVPSR
jgi:hypothetical protein